MGCCGMRRDVLQASHENNYTIYYYDYDYEEEASYDDHDSLQCRCFGL